MSLESGPVEVGAGWNGKDVDASTGMPVGGDASAIDGVGVGGATGMKVDGAIVATDGFVVGGGVTNAFAVGELVFAADGIDVDGATVAFEFGVRAAEGADVAIGCASTSKNLRSALFADDGSNSPAK